MKPNYRESRINVSPGNSKKQSFKIYHLLQIHGDPNFKLPRNSARKGSLKAVFLPVGWVYQNKKDADEVAKRWSQGDRKINIVRWFDHRLDKIWNGNKSEAVLARKSIKLELDKNRLNKRKEEIEIQCYFSGLHHSWLYAESLPDDMSEQDKKTHAHFKPLWDKTFADNQEIDLRSADLVREEEDIGENQKNSVEPIFRPYSFSELLSKPAKEWLLEHVFGVGDLGMIYGPPGCGKTFVVIDLILCLCLGWLWAKRFIVKRPLNVVYCAGEGVSGLPSRFMAAAKFHDVEMLYNFTFFETIPQLYPVEQNSNITTINQFIGEWKSRQLTNDANRLDVLVIDTLHTASISADENSAQDMGKVLHSCRTAANELGCAIILVHHTNKTGNSERGSSALRGAMDFMIEIKKSGDDGTNATMSCSKLKDGEAWKDLPFTLTSTKEGCSAHVLWHDDARQTTTKGSKEKDKNSLLRTMEKNRGTKFTCKSLSEAIGKKDNHTNNLLNEMLMNGMCKRELNDPKKESSNRNPWTYFVENSG